MSFLRNLGSKEILRPLETNGGGELRANNVKLAYVDSHIPHKAFVCLRKRMQRISESALRISHDDRSNDRSLRIHQRDYSKLHADFLRTRRNQIGHFPRCQTSLSLGCQSKHARVENVDGRRSHDNPTLQGQMPVPMISKRVDNGNEKDGQRKGKALGNHALVGILFNHFQKFPHQQGQPHLTQHGQQLAETRWNKRGRREAPQCDEQLSLFTALLVCSSCHRTTTSRLKVPLKELCQVLALHTLWYREEVVLRQTEIVRLVRSLAQNGSHVTVRPVLVLALETT